MPRKIKLSEIESFTTSFPVSSGGTGATSFAANSILYGNGTSAIQADSNFIWESGRLGIGESSPQDLLHIKNSSVGSNAGLRLENDAQTWALYCRGFDSDKFKIQDIDADTSPFVIETTAPNNALYLDSSGNVGIGTSSPSSKLEVDGSIQVTAATGASSGKGLELSGNSSLGEVLAFDRDATGALTLNLRGETVNFQTVS